MSVESLARQVSRATRDEVNASLDLETRLRDLHVTRLRRGRTKAVSVLVSVSAAVALAVAVMPRETVDDVAPAGSPNPSVVEQGCSDQALVRCLHDNKVLIGGRTPYTLRLPPGSDVRAVPHSIDIFRPGTDRAGVTIIDGVRAAGSQEDLGARELARWVRSRGFLHASPVVRGTLDGFDTWTVQVRLLRGRTLEAEGACSAAPQGACLPVLGQSSRSGWESGVWLGMLSRYTFLEVPGLGTVALWSWTFGGRGDLERSEAVVRSIDFRLPS